MQRNSASPRVSVVIPAFEEEKFIAETLRSILIQTFTDYELIVVDNGSRDRTGELARTYGATVIVEPHKGVGVARQRGFLIARGEIIACTDADTVVPPTWLATIVQEFDDDRDLVAFGGLAELRSGPPTAKNAVRFLFRPYAHFDRIVSGGWNLLGCNMAVKRDAFLGVGGFATDLAIGEDAYISKKLRRVGTVRMNCGFIVSISGRRFRSGFLRGLMAYFPYWLGRVLLRKDLFQRLPDIRDEYVAHDKHLPRGATLRSALLLGSACLSAYIAVQIWSRKTRWLAKSHYFHGGSAPKRFVAIHSLMLAQTRS